MGEVSLVENNDSMFAMFCTIALPLLGRGREDALENMLEVSNEILWAIQNERDREMDRQTGTDERGNACARLFPAKGSHLKLSPSTCPLPV